MISINVKSKLAAAFFVLAAFLLFRNYFLYRSPEVALKTVRAPAAGVLDKSDLDFVSYPKAVLLDTLLDCVLRSETTDHEDDVEPIPGRHNQTELHRVLKSTPAKTLRKMISKLHSDLKRKDGVISFLSQPIVNNHDFEYVHNASDACQGETLDFLFVVTSAPGYFERREDLRSWDLYLFAKNKTNKAKLLFFLGKPSEGSDAASIQSRIDAEVEKYGDIVQVGFEDVYRSLVNKVVSIFKWAGEYCSSARFVVRLDDDVIIDIEKSLLVVRGKGDRYANFILGYMRVGGTPERWRWQKHFVTIAEYPDDTFPPYVLGPFQAYSMCAVSLLYQAALRVEPLWIEDVYLTGICAPKVGVPIFNHTDFDYANRAW